MLLFGHKLLQIFTTVSVISIFYSSVALAKPERKCTIHLHKSVSDGVAETLQAKGYKTQEYNQQPWAQFKWRIPVGQFGITWKSLDADQRQLFLFYRNASGDSGLISVLPSYFSLENVSSKDDIGQSVPACDVFASARTEIVQKARLTKNIKLTVQLLSEGLKQGPLAGRIAKKMIGTQLVGEFIIENELLLDNISDPLFESKATKLKSLYRAFIADLKAKGFDQLKTAEDFEGLRKFLVDGLVRQYCQTDSRMSHYFNVLSSCGNFMAQTALIVAVWFDLELTPPEGMKFGIQDFSDHRRAVLYDSSTNESRDLTYSPVHSTENTGPILEPEALFWHFINEAERKYPAALPKGKSFDDHTLLGWRVIRNYRSMSLVTRYLQVRDSYYSQWAVGAHWDEVFNTEAFFKNMAKSTVVPGSSRSIEFNSRLYSYTFGYESYYPSGSSGSDAQLEYKTNQEREAEQEREQEQEPKLEGDGFTTGLPQFDAPPLANEEPKGEVVDDSVEETSAEGDGVENTSGVGEAREKSNQSTPEERLRAVEEALEKIRADEIEVLREHLENKSKRDLLREIKSGELDHEETSQNLSPLAKDAYERSLAEMNEKGVSEAAAMTEQELKQALEKNASDYLEEKLSDGSLKDKLELIVQEETRAAAHEVETGKSLESATDNQLFPEDVAEALSEGGQRATLNDRSLAEEAYEYNNKKFLNMSSDKLQEMLDRMAVPEPAPIEGVDSLLTYTNELVTLEKHNQLIEDSLERVNDMIAGMTESDLRTYLNDRERLNEEFSNLSPIEKDILESAFQQNRENLSEAQIRDTKVNKLRANLKGGAQKRATELRDQQSLKDKISDIAMEEARILDQMLEDGVSLVEAVEMRDASGEGLFTEIAKDAIEAVVEAENVSTSQVSQEQVQRQIKKQIDDLSPEQLEALMASEALKKEIRAGADISQESPLTEVMERAEADTDTDLSQLIAYEVRRFRMINTGKGALINKQTDKNILCENCKSLSQPEAVAKIEAITEHLNEPERRRVEEALRSGSTDQLFQELSDILHFNPLIEGYGLEQGIGEMILFIAAPSFDEENSGEAILLNEEIKVAGTGRQERPQYFLQGGRIRSYRAMTNKERWEYLVSEAESTVDEVYEGGHIELLIDVLERRRHFFELNGDEKRLLLEMKTTPDFPFETLVAAWKIAIKEIGDDGAAAMFTHKYLKWKNKKYEVYNAHGTLYLRPVRAHKELSKALLSFGEYLATSDAVRFLNELESGELLDTVEYFQFLQNLQELNREVFGYSEDTGISSNKDVEDSGRTFYEVDLFSKPTQALLYNVLNYREKLITVEPTVSEQNELEAHKQSMNEILSIEASSAQETEVLKSSGGPSRVTEVELISDEEYQQLVKANAQEIEPHLREEQHYDPKTLLLLLYFQSEQVLSHPAVQLLVIRMWRQAMTEALEPLVTELDGRLFAFSARDQSYYSHFRHLWDINGMLLTEAHTQLIAESKATECTARSTAGGPSSLDWECYQANYASDLLTETPKWVEENKLLFDSYAWLQRIRQRFVSYFYMKSTEGNILAEEGRGIVDETMRRYSYLKITPPMPEAVARVVYEYNDGASYYLSNSSLLRPSRRSADLDEVSYFYCSQPSDWDYGMNAEEGIIASVFSVSTDLNKAIVYNGLKPAHCPENEHAYEGGAATLLQFSSIRSPMTGDVFMIVTMDSEGSYLEHANVDQSFPVYYMSYGGLLDVLPEGSYPKPYSVIRTQGL